MVIGADVLAGSTGIGIPLLAATSSAHSARPHPTVAQNHRAATRDAPEPRRRLHLPAGATPSAHEPAGDGGLLKDPPSCPATPSLVDQTRWCTSKEPLQQVISYVKAHPPTGGSAQLSEPGTNQTLGGTT